MIKLKNGDAPILSSDVLRDIITKRVRFKPDEFFGVSGESAGWIPFEYDGFLGLENLIRNKQFPPLEGILYGTFVGQDYLTGKSPISYKADNNRTESFERIDGSAIIADAIKYNIPWRQSGVENRSYAIQAAPPSFPIYDLVGKIATAKELEKFDTDPNAIFSIQGSLITDDRDMISVLYIKRGSLMLPVYTNRWREASSWVQLRDSMLIPFIGMMISFIPGVGAVVGSMIVGPAFAAAYPAVTAALGAIATSTAVNGGDVKAAVTSYFAAQAGAFIGGVIDIPVVSGVASAVTRTVLLGGDVNQAALIATIKGGASYAADLYDSGDVMDNSNYSDAGTEGYGDWGNDVNYFDPASYSDAAYGYGDYWSTPADNTLNYSDAGTYGYGDWGDNYDPYSAPGGATGSWDTPDPSNYSDAGTYGYGESGSWSQPAPTNPLNYSDAGSPGYNDSGAWGNTTAASTWSNPTTNSNSNMSFDQMVTTFGKVVTIGLGLNNAIKGYGNTLPPAGSLQQGQIAQPNGRTNTGAQLPAGSVYRTADGSAVTNNGNGTYTLVKPNGASTIVSYATGKPTQQFNAAATPGASSGLSSLLSGNTLLYAGLGIGAALLLKGRKK